MVVQNISSDTVLFVQLSDMQIITLPNGFIIMKTLEIREKSQKNIGGYTYEMTHTSTANFPELQSFVPYEC